MIRWLGVVAEQESRISQSSGSSTAREHYLSILSCCVTWVNEGRQQHIGVLSLHCTAVIQRTKATSQFREISCECHRKTRCVAAATLLNISHDEEREGHEIKWLAGGQNTNWGGLYYTSSYDYHTINALPTKQFLTSINRHFSSSNQPCNSLRRKCSIKSPIFFTTFRVKNVTSLIW